MEIDRKRLSALAFVLVLVVSTLPLGVAGTATATPASSEAFTIQQNDQCYVVHPYTGLQSHVEHIDETYVAAGGETEAGPYTEPNWDRRDTVESVMDYRFRYDPEGVGQGAPPIGQYREDAPYLGGENDWYLNDPWNYSTYGLYNWSENGESHMFFYDGADGISLVMRHDRLYDTLDIGSHMPYRPNYGGLTEPSPGGGAATFEFRNLPRGEWAYLDDMLPNRWYSDVYTSGDTTYYHQYDEGGGTSYKTFSGGNFTANWRWMENSNDGGAYRGFENLDGEVTIEPNFNQDAAYWGANPGGSSHEPITSWEIRDAQTGEWHTLNMSEPLTITRGSNCADEPTSTPTTTTTITTTTTTTTTTTETTSENTTTTTTTTENPTTTTPEATTTTTTTETTTERPETTRESNHDDDDDSGSSGGAASFGGGANPPSVIADVERVGTDRVKVDVANARVGESVDFRLPADAQTTKGLRFTELDIAMADDDAHFVLDVSTSADAPSGVTGIEDADATMGYVRIGHEFLDDEQVKSATFRFSVSKARLDEAGLAAEDVSLYRHRGGEWTKLNTSVAEEKTNRYVLEAASPGFSTFAVAGTKTVSVTDLSLVESTIEAGGNATLTANVENAGTSERIYVAELTLDGEVVDSKEVAVAAGGSSEVTFSRAFETTGNYRLSVGDVDADLVVEQRRTTEETADGISTSIAGGETTNDSGQSGFGALAALLALVAAALVALRRR